MIWQVTFWARIKFSLVPGFRDLLTFAHLVWILICILIIWVNRVLKYEHFQGYFVVLWLILPEIQWFLFNIPLNFGSKRASMSATYDVIFSVIVGLPKVYPNFLDVPHSVLQQCEEKLRAPLMHTGTPSGSSGSLTPTSEHFPTITTGIQGHIFVHFRSPLRTTIVLHPLRPFLVARLFRCQVIN